MPTALLASLVAALAAAAPVKLAAPGLSYVNVDEKVGDFMVDYLAQQLVAQGIAVTTKTQVNALLGFERQKSLLGCSGQSASCLAELAGALGVDGLVTGSLARTAKGSYVINITVVAARDGRSVGAMSARAPDDDALLDVLATAARQLAPKVISELGPKPASAATHASSSTTRPASGTAASAGNPVALAAGTTGTPAASGRTRFSPAAPPPESTPAPDAGGALATTGPALGPQPFALPKWISLGVGGAAALASGSLYGVAVAQRAALDGTPTSVDSRAKLDSRLTDIRNFQTGAAVAGAVALLGLGGFGLGMFLDRPPAVAIAPAAGGSVVSVEWELP